MAILKKRDKREKGLEAINSHKGKRKVYEAYKKQNPKMAEEYIKFHAKQPDAVYITWDEDKGRFTS